MAKDKKKHISRVAVTRLPFEINRTGGLGLAKQLFEGLSAAISGGILKPDETLPTLHELAAHFDVSLRTTRMALDRLTREGFVSTRPRVGSVVIGKAPTVWRGHLLMVQVGEDVASYYDNMLAAVLRRNLFDNGYLFSRFVIGTDDSGRWNKRDAAALELVLKHSVDLCFVMWSDKRICRRLAAAGIPYVLYGSRTDRPRGCRGVADSSADAAISQFVAHCGAAGVRSIVQFDFDHRQGFDAVPHLSAAGIGAERCVFPKAAGMGRLESIRLGGYLGMRNYLSRHRRHFPDLLLFVDDLTAAGAFAALLEAGVKVPEEVRIVTLTNAGNEPLFPKPLSRFEHDPNHDGVVVANYLISLLRGVDCPTCVSIGPTYRAAETFPG